MAMIQLRVLGGAMARVGADETAFAHRDAGVMALIITPFETPPTEPAHRAWTDALHEKLATNAVGVYSNFLETEGDERIRPPTRRHLRAPGRRQAPLRPVEPVPP